MMGMLWVILFSASTGLHLIQGLPVRPTPEVYPHDANEAAAFQGWGSQVLYGLPALALVLTAVGLLFGCTWCYRHKDCKPNEGADNQLFVASASHLQDARRVQPDSGFAEPANNNISEDNNNGPISLREMQNIANNNAAAYIVSENEERNRISRESVVEFEPLPADLRVVDPLERCADWFGGEDLPRNRLQYLREIGRGWFGRVLEGELEEDRNTTVAVKILNQNASLEEKARFLDDAKIYRDSRHENILAFVAKCLQEDPWILLFELCSMDLQQYLILNRPKMAILNESGVPLQLMCDVTSALAYLHSRGFLYGSLWSGNVLVRGGGESVRAVLGQYCATEPPHDCAAPETRRHHASHTSYSEVWSLGTLVWEVCAWGAAPPASPPPPDLPCPYRTHLYQVMQLCWNPNPDGRPSAAQVHALLNHLHSTHVHSATAQDDGYGSSDFEERWQRLKPNTIPKIDEHVAIVHAPSTSMSSHFTGSDQDFDNAPTTQDTLSVDLDTAVSRSSSIMSDKDPLSVQIKSESLTNLHGSLEDVRNIYLTHNETAAIECHQGNVSLEDSKDKDHDRSDSSMDPWLKDIITGSQDDVSYYKDVSDVIKNLDNILNSEKTSSSESSHQASPSRDNLSLECKKDYPVHKSMVKSPGISNFQNILEVGFNSESQQMEACDDDDVDRDTIGTLSHSFERHSDSISQHTLENLTPETPIKDLDDINRIECETGALHENIIKQDNIVFDIEKHSELPKDNKVDHSISEIPMLKELCVASMPRVSESIIQQLNVREDCQTPCDNKLTDVRIDFNDFETKSIDDVTTLVESEEKSNTESATVAVITELEPTQKMDSETKNVKSHDEILPISQNELPTVAMEDDTTFLVINDIYKKGDEKERVECCLPPEKVNVDFEGDENNTENAIIDIAFSPIKSVISSPEKVKITDFEETFEPENFQTTLELNEIPEIVQNLVDTSNSQIDNVSFQNSKMEENIRELEIFNTLAEHTLPPELVQNKSEEVVNNDNAQLEENVFVETVKTNDIILHRSDLNKEIVENVIKEITNDSTSYMDLINDTTNDFSKDNNVYNANNDNTSYFISTGGEIEKDKAGSIVSNNSTVYLDLPSAIKETHSFLNSERIICSQTADFKDVCSSTPKGSDRSIDNTLENSTIENEYDILSETKVPECGSGVTFFKLEQRCVPDNMSPLESPTKSHHTDTYDENSSVVLGPFENCTLELFKAVKSEMVDLPREELLAFSSNFSEMDLETPSPLRDGNFLNEVPDIVHDDLQFDDVVTVSEAKPESTEAQSDDTENTDDKSSTEKHISPLTPPNSPGALLASTSQQKYIVDIDLSTPNGSVPHTTASTLSDSGAPQPSDSGMSSLQKEIDLNQIELQITTKMAMAENENNLNIEYSGPLTVEGFVIEDEVLMRESDAIPESYLAGNGRPLEDLRDLTLDEECVKALRNELELKLPLAQVAGIEPAVEGEWGAELPPPPDLVLSYPGALSPIAEETRQQLSAYENDTNWNLSTRTESSESYPEPCNNSTDEVTDLPTGVQSGLHEYSTYTIQSKENSPNNTYTVHKDIGSSKEITMSADSLNASPLKKLKDEPLSPIDDKTYNKNDDEKISNCERLSQVSPFLLSPTTDTSAPENSDNIAGCSTLSKPTVPTDAKSSKPSETQCLSKATSIDSWCSNDTLYNLEENFDDLAMDPDVPLDFEREHEPEKDEKSESTDTLTHNDEEKEQSHCSTYIIHDSKSEVCETFSPDSITANDNNTYTKPKTEPAVTTPSVITKSELNDSTKNTQTKDLAYGTLMSGLPSYSNCTTEVLSTADEAWKLPQPELVRRSPIGDTFNFTPPKPVEDKDCTEISSPRTKEPSIKRMDSVEVTCLKDNSDSQNKSELESEGLLIEINESQDYHYRNMAHSVTSTPLTEVGVDNDNVEAIPMQLPEIRTENSEYHMNNVPNFQAFLQSAEIRPQDISSNVSNECVSSNQDTEILLEGESKTLSRNSNKDSLAVCDRTPTYSDFENSATSKPQDLHSKEKSTSLESAANSEDFRNFENSARDRPQDLSSLIDASSLLLKSERRSSELAMEFTNNLEQTNRSVNLVNNFDTQSLVISPPNTTNLNESHIKDINKPIDVFIADLDMEEETEQPHSIIITESPLLVCKSSPSPNRTYDSHIVDMAYDSHLGLFQPLNKEHQANEIVDTSKLNAVETNEIGNDHKQSSEPDITGDSTGINEPITVSSHIDNHTVESNVLQERLKSNINKEAVKCNGDSQKYATVNFLNESFEELLESNVDDNDSRDFEIDLVNKELQDIDKQTDKAVGSTQNNVSEAQEEHKPENIYENLRQSDKLSNGDLEELEEEDKKMTSVTENFLQNEKKFCQLDSYLPLLSDIRFTGPATEIMSTSFNQDSPTETTSPECEQESKPDTATDILKEWDSDSESHSTNSSSGEFIWKDGDGHETSVVPSTHFDHQREGGSQAHEGRELSGSAGNASSGSDGSEGSEGDEVEFVPSSWDCRAAPAKSSLRSLEQAPPDSKKRVVFKRQKYHCVYEYPREVADVDAESPAYLPDFSTYSDNILGPYWVLQIGIQQVQRTQNLAMGNFFGAPNPLDLFPLRAGIAFGADYDEDFFISSSARPFESLGVMSTTSQFFPGMHVKPSLLERDIDDLDEFPPPPSPLPPTTLVQTRTPSLDFTTPDSGVEDITPGSTSTEDDFKTKKVSDNEACWRAVDSASSSESVSPSSPGGEALGGLRHTRDKLKLDLPPSPHIPSPRHNRVFNFVLDKPKRRSQEERTEIGTTPLVMTDETPIITTSLPLQKESDDVVPEPTFSTFGKCASKNAEPEQKAIILTDEIPSEEPETKEESSNQKVEAVKGEGTVLDSGDEDSGIESSSKATLERNKTTPNVS